MRNSWKSNPMEAVLTPSSIIMIIWSCLIFIVLNGTGTENLSFYMLSLDKFCVEQVKNRLYCQKEMQFLSILKYYIGFMHHQVVSFLILYVCLNSLRRRVVQSIKNIFYQSFHRICLFSIFRVLNHGRQGLYKL